MEKKYKVNEVARIFGVSRQTLVYYDRIKLFEPKYIDSENSYRYYVQNQFQQLRFIMILKEAGFSLNEIKEYTRSRTPEESIYYLEGRESEIEKKIKLLEESKQTIKKKINELKNISEKSKSKPKIIDVDTRRVFKVGLETPFSFEDYDKKFYQMMLKKEKFGIEGEKFLEELDRASIEETDYMGLKSIGFYIPENMDFIEGEEIIEGGRYATIFHGEELSRIGESYEKVMEYIDIKGYVLAGDAIEVFSRIMVHLGKGEGTTMRIYLPIKTK